MNGIDQKPIETLKSLSAIFGFYESWTLGLDLACRKGCAACCTCSVTVTEPEAEFILQGLAEKKQHTWLAGQMQDCTKRGRPQLTTNAWATCCLNGEECDDRVEQVLEPCPFLDANQCCRIYELRPFSCRCFGSTTDCAKTGTASQPNLLIEINTVTMQLIEHLADT